jgi:hypothetical protein
MDMALWVLIVAVYIKALLINSTNSRTTIERARDIWNNKNQQQ